MMMVILTVILASLVIALDPLAQPVAFYGAFICEILAAFNYVVEGPDAKTP